MDPTNNILMEQIKEKDGRIKALETTLKHWQQNAHDTRERLNRVYQNRNKPNYVDAFYDHSYRHLIEKLTKENVLLNNEHNVNEVRSMASLKQQITDLRNELNECNIRIDELTQDNNERLVSNGNSTINKLQNENMKYRKQNDNLRQRYNAQQDVINCVRSEFTKQRKEFMKIFLTNYQRDGQAFIDQLNSLDIETIPDFLLKPMRVSIGTTCEGLGTGTDEVDIVPVVEPICLSEPVKDSLKDSLKDSGVDTLPEEFRQAMEHDHIKELNEEIKKNEKLEELLKRKNQENFKMQMDYSRVFGDNSQLQRQLDAAFNEMASSNVINKDRVKKLEDENKNLMAICQLYEQQGEGFPAKTTHTTHATTTMLTTPVARMSLKARGPELSQSRCTPFPYPFNQHQHQQRPMLVRDSGKSPVESKENTFLTSRGPSSASPHSSPHSSPHTSPHTSQEEKNILARQSSQSRKQAVESSGYMECSVCKQIIAIDEFASHSLICTKKPSLP